MIHFLLQHEHLWWDKDEAHEAKMKINIDNIDYAKTAFWCWWSKQKQQQKTSHTSSSRIQVAALVFPRHRKRDSNRRRSKENKSKSQESRTRDLIVDTNTSSLRTNMHLFTSTHFGPPSGPSGPPGTFASLFGLAGAGPEKGRTGHWPLPECVISRRRHITPGLSCRDWHMKTYKNPWRTDL